MRSICCPLFCILSLFFLVSYLTSTPRLDLNWNFLLSMALTGVLAWMFYGLYRFIRRLRINPTLWRIIYALIGILILLVVISVPEIRVVILGWLEKIAQPVETLLVLSVLCLIICALCCTRPARSTSSS